MTRDGISLHALKFRSHDLVPHMDPGRRQMVRYDPRDLSRVYLETPTDFIAAKLAGGYGISFSLWEWRELRALELKAGRPRDPQVIARELAANRSLIRENVVRGRRGAARRLAREAQWFIEPDARTEHKHLLKVGASTRPHRCRVEGDDRW